MCKFVEFKKRVHRLGEISYDVISKKTGELLAGIAIEHKWKKWVFITSDMYLFDAECLQDIVNFMRTLK